MLRRTSIAATARKTINIRIGEAAKRKLSGPKRSASSLPSSFARLPAKSADEKLIP